MSEKQGLGLFINKKAGGASGAAAAAPSLSGGAPKNVKKRWMYVGVGLIGLIVLSSSLFGNKPEQLAKRQPKEAPMVKLDPPGADKKAFESQFGQEMAAMRADVQRMQADLKAKDAQLQELKNGRGVAQQQLPAGVVPPPSAPGSNTGGLTSISAPPVPPVPPVRANVPVSTPPTLQGITPPPTASMPLPPMNDGQPLVFDAPAASDANASSGANAGLPSATAKMRYRKNESAGMLPAGAFASVSLLNGLDAGTSQMTQNNPMPILLRITDQAVLPGSAKYRLKNCFVLGTAYGEMSAERVYGRLSRLSCVDKKDRLVLSQEIQGYLVDSDGKLGMRGVISDRQGAKLGKAMLAGFAQGLAGALGQAQGTVLSNTTTGTTTSSITGQAALRASGLSGAQTAASQLAEFYMKEAAALFPVISVDAGRIGTIVFSGTVNLNWVDADNQFVQQYTPENK